MHCQRISIFKIRCGEALIFCCKDHLVDMVVELLVYRLPGEEAAITLHPVVNEEPCEF